MLINPDDLVDPTDIAQILGLSRRSAVSVYQRRYPDFPSPVIDMGPGRCALWLRQDITTWAKTTGRS